MMKPSAADEALIEKYSHAASAALLGMDSAEPDPQVIVDSAHSFGFVFKSVREVMDRLEAAGLQGEVLCECMSRALAEVMADTNAAEQYDYLLKVVRIKEDPGRDSE